MKILKPHQENAIAYLKKKFGGLLFMEMRLGKNLTMIRHLQGIGIHNKILIITDYGAMRSWELEIKSEGEKCITLTGNKERRLKLLHSEEANHSYIISNYESAKQLDLHKAHMWKVVILDETIKIANPKAIITKYMLSAFSKVLLKYVLNGKPMPENQMQLACQFLFVHKNYMGCTNFWQYRAKYYEPDSTGFNWIPKANHVKQVNAYVHNNSFIQTRKDVCIGSDKVYTNRYVRMTLEQKVAMKHLAKFYEYEDVSYQNELGLMLGLSYMAGGISPSEKHTVLSTSKLEELLTLLNNEIDDNKILIWCKFRAEQDLIMKFLDSHNIGHICINGGLTKTQRDNYKTEFETKPYIKCAVLTIKSSAKGQDWSTASTSIYYSREWSNDLQSQSEDRLIHVNKITPVLIIHLITEKSIDEDVLLALRNKEFDSKLVMGNFLQRLTKNKEALVC